MGEASFHINGKHYKVNAKTVKIDTSLNTFIRHNAELSGTKTMCLEGGCGACIVTLKGRHPVTKELRTWAVNSCLMPIFSCHELEIFTIEGIGNFKTDYHPLQRRLAEFNGTQCGYCSPGMVMNMYSLLESKNGNVTMEEVENSFGGNICRCTGYRPILDAFKSFASDTDYSYIDICNDIEDLTICPKTEKECTKQCQKYPNVDKMTLLFDNDDNKNEWNKVYSLKDLFEILSKLNNRKYMLVAGNTATGVYRRDTSIQVFIDITNIQDLRCHNITGNNLILGGNVTLTEAMDIFRNVSNKKDFEYCLQLANHIDLVANVPVRNNGTIAGNLCIKKEHREFPSDIFLILETIGANLVISDANNKTTTITIKEFLDFDMYAKVILNVVLPKLDAKQYKFYSYKITPRAQNAHAYVNAGFLIQFNDANKVTSARICYGGISPKFIHARNTEKLIVGLNIYENVNLQTILRSLFSEIHPNWVLPDVSPEYRKNLAISLFYKFVLKTYPLTLPLKPEFISGGDILHRDISSGQQKFETVEKLWPLTQPVLKLEALIQASGEAEYVNDIPPLRDELWAAFVPATKVQSRIGRIDASEALSIPGVHYFFAAKDIPGKNNHAVPLLLQDEPEQIFAEINGKVLYYGQPIGVILAEDFNLANYAATKVKVMYERNSTDDNAKLFPTVKDIVESENLSRLHKMPNTKLVDIRNGVNANKQVSGRFQIGGQYHFSMEVQSAVCIPKNGGEIDVWTSTQWMDHAQIAIAQSLNIPENKINITVNRLGGGFGAKISRSSHIAAVAALGCYLTNRPVRFVMTIESNMTVIGKRYACISDYDVEVNENGKIQKLTNNCVEDFGCSLNESVFTFTEPGFVNCYLNDTWSLITKAAITDAPSNTWCRAPGTLEGIAMIENIMEHIVHETGKDPISVRLENMPAESPMRTLVTDFVKKSEFYERRNDIDEFNKLNRWRKRGIGISFMKFDIPYFGAIPTFVAIYHADGSVVVTHGGTEIGQGINTKVAQVTAYKLGIPLDKVRVKASNNVIAANAFVTGASVTSDTVCMGAIKACDILLERMKPVRDSLTNPTWTDITQACFAQMIDLTANYLCKVSDLTAYQVWGLSCTEIEIDILTGSLLIKRVDLLEDTGRSMSPNIDVGQIEGAFIMGVGYWLTENLVYNRENGELLTNRTWTYKPPGAKDIPIDFRVTLIQLKNNTSGVLRSKAVGEPAICLSISAIFALRYALRSSRGDAGLKDVWFPLGAPTTPEIAYLNSGNSINLFEV